MKDQQEVRSTLGSSKVENQFRIKEIPEAWKFEKALDTLRGTARSWVAREATNGLIDWIQLKKFMIENFGCPGLQRELRREINALRQEGSVSEYVDKFMILRVQIEEIAQDEEMEYFECGLKYEIREKIQCTIIKSLREMIQNSLMAEKKVNPIKRNEIIQNDLFYMRSKNNYQRGNNKKNYSKDKGKDRKCFDCGKPGHLAKDCWSSPKNNGNNYEQSKKQLNMIEDAYLLAKCQDKKERRSIQGVLNGKPVSVLIDSGASENFVRESLTHDLTEGKLDQAKIIQEAGGRTTKIDQLFKGKLGLGPFEFGCCFLPFPMVNYDVILGQPWLQKFNPVIRWRTGSIIIDDTCF